MIGGCLVLSVRSIVRLAGAPRDGPDGAPTRALAAATLAALVAWSLASLFLHLSLVRTLWVVLALAGLLHTLTKDEHAPRGRALLDTEKATKDLADVTAEYLVKVGPYTPATDGRISRK